MRSRGLVAAVAAIAAGCAAPTAEVARTPQLARSPQWREATHSFENPPAWPSRIGNTAMLRWQLGGRPRPAPFEPPFVANDGLRLRANRDRATVTWIGHATVLVQSGGVNVLTDPMFSDAILGAARRFAPPGVTIGRLPPIDVVLVSHNHRDHLDEESVLLLGPEVHYVVPLGMARWFRERGLTRVTELDWWESTTVPGRRGGEVKVTMVPAQHWSQRGLGDRNQSLWGGWVFDAGGRRFYHAGDTGFPAAFDEIGKRLPGIDVAMIPIGAYAPRWFLAPQHIDPQQAAEAFRRVGARVVLPIHWGTFRLSDEPMGEPPGELYRAMGRDANRILFLPIGGTYWLDENTRGPS